MNEKRDYYEILGISRQASKSEIRAAYRKLARKNHPDVSDAPDAEEKFKEINEAYQILNDDEKRAVYDRYGHSGLDRFGMGGGFEGFDSFEDIFDSFFGFGSAGTRRKGGPRRGSDLRYDLEITFQEAVFGCTKEIEISRLETCPRCGGTGAEPGTHPIRCPECNGTGQVRHAQQSIFGSFVNVTTCPRCGGRGEIIETPCSRCHGSRRVEVTRTISVDVPAGIDDGMRIRLAGEGESGLDGGPAGNLYVVMHVKNHRYFRRRDQDILLNININVAQAALGDEILVPTLNGERQLVIPAGTQTGAIFQLKGEGVPRIRGSGRGDEIVIINVEIPESLNDQQKELFARLGETLGDEITPQEEKSFLKRLKVVLGL
ncbi:MAG: molecular chaperone DnaJ [Chloroflexota bacterium]|nr:molecular chaperone DnaJ [Chloroflexota bacterium]